jgi:LacI family transcriptional regulator
VSLKKFRVALLLLRGHEYAARLIEGILSYVSKRASFEFVEIPCSETGTPPVIYNLNVQGALVWGHHNLSGVLDLRERGVKIVSLNGEWLADGIPCVGFDLDAAVKLAVEHLAQFVPKVAVHAGHLSAGNPGKIRFRDAFLNRARKVGWKTMAFEIRGVPSEERHRLAEPANEPEIIQFLRGLTFPACIYCDDDYVGVLLAQVARHIGLAVPGDIYILGFFDLAIARFSTPTLSSIPAHGEIVGAAGIQLLDELLHGAPAPKKQVLVPPSPVIQRESTGGNAVLNDGIRRARRLIEELACQGLSVSQLVESLGISQKTLNKRFAAVYGMTPGAAIRQHRANRAKHLLATTELSIARIAEMCGFGEPSNFNFFFNRDVGCAPGEYRRSSRQT